jgi:hypothetical protein
MRNVIFLDIDGVLNSELFYRERHEKSQKEAKKAVKRDEIERLEYYKSNICLERIQWLNELCEETDSVIVVSSTWRSGKSIQDLQEMFNYCGATFIVVGKTGHCECRIRGVEIRQWLEKHCMEYFGVNYYDFYRYAIIDDDGDMLLWQQDHFFQTDNWSGLTPTTCYKIKRFFTHKTF